MKRQGGFTLIELVVVIVILGILAVTAAPRFLNLQDDARTATLEGLRGAVAGAMGISYGKAAINGIEATTYTAFTDDDNPGTVVEGIAHSFGYPVAVNDETANQGGIMQTLDVSNEFVVLDSSEDDATDPTNTTIDIGIDGYTVQCVQYTAAIDANTPATVLIVDGADGNCGL
ncbi:MSHA pilin protein MshA [Vibrio crassostreae]|uniref:type II secretion system protein n=1 Tax=Vibrio TaxID=662 RepID=UPI0002E3819E|nr:MULTISPECIES: type II secretion system protein [Vibrio]ANP77635.1 MSHA biogenesis protein MshA [Vibrio crassostreae 9CS106]PMK11662.1 MSHA biogenesis protein MshA [Vibrio sp. 10N.261.54.E10]TWD39662.1 MSHA pilin protein MshA [Vibrio crassostreae]